jgi:hypothetical protein
LTGDGSARAHAIKTVVFGGHDLVGRVAVHPSVRFGGAEGYAVGVIPGGCLFHWNVDVVDVRG